MKIRHTSRRPRLGWVLLLILAWSQLADAAQPGWISDRVKVHLRSGAGDEYRITGTVAHPQEIRVLETELGWARVRLVDSQREGWIRSEYLTQNPPASRRVTRLEEENRGLRDHHDGAAAETERLLGENQALIAAEERQRATITNLTRERNELRALLRWREWITGASILVVGMITGALLARSSRRNRSTRLRI